MNLNPYCTNILVLLLHFVDVYLICFRAECHELMLQLKATVEGLLALPSVNVWNIHGGLERLDRCVCRILKHRIKASSVSNLCWACMFVSLQSPALFHIRDTYHRFR